MFKDDYKKSMSFPLRQELLQDTADLLAQSQSPKRQDRWLWGRNVAFAALACLMITLGVRYSALSGVNLSAGSGGAAPQTAGGTDCTAAMDEASSVAMAMEDAAEEGAEAPAGEPSVLSEEFADLENQKEAELQMRSSITAEELDSAVFIGLEDVRRLAALGETLDWNALEQVGLFEEGEFPVEGGTYFLRVEGTDPKDLSAVTLCLWESPEVSIDIRNADVELFLVEYTPADQ